MGAKRIATFIHFIVDISADLNSIVNKIQE